jgi:hypothetical protein
MRSLIALAMVLCLAAPTVAENRHPVRIPIYHADPWAVKALLEGRAIMSPEISTIMSMGGMNPGAAQNAQNAANQANAMFSGGFLIVNPTDNSLWFIPDKKS